MTQQEPKFYKHLPPTDATRVAVTSFILARFDPSRLELTELALVLKYISQWGLFYTNDPQGRSYLSEEEKSVLANCYVNPHKYVSASTYRVIMDILNSYYVDPF